MGTSGRRSPSGARRNPQAKLKGKGSKLRRVTADPPHSKSADKVPRSTSSTHGSQKPVLPDAPPNTRSTRQHRKKKPGKVREASTIQQKIPEGVGSRRQSMADHRRYSRFSRVSRQSRVSNCRSTSSFTITIKLHPYHLLMDSLTHGTPRVSGA